MGMDTLISSWCFSSYVKVFEDNKIEVLTLYLLNFEALSVFIPPIGDRLKFLGRLEDFKRDREMTGDMVDEEVILGAEIPEFTEIPESSITDASSEAPTEDQNKRLVPCPETRTTRRRVDESTSREKVGDSQGDLDLTRLGDSIGGRDTTEEGLVEAKDLVGECVSEEKEEELDPERGTPEIG
ncbi:uncharacterized protein LOC117182899 [Belonocnema kinseyi]|uniref:uncharacterized protein LOC117182899 n=1 Tax=Belonocnema kinseyi TaxID=2817044 RepID=UPI00143D8311|nr:uncharacterized protein LOC117182899 [Belonocnema kinseyi]